MTITPQGTPSSAETGVFRHDQFSIHTPELVAIEFPMAGVGSRFIAVLVDYLIQILAVVILILTVALIVAGSGSSGHVASTTSNISDKWAMAIAIAIPFCFTWGYFTLFEAFWHGQTPGKRWMRIRVIQQTGRPVSWIESMARNFLRVVDYLPSFYIVGVITMFVTSRQQRIGDLVAGTLVVHERDLETPLESIGQSRMITSHAFQAAPVVAPPREAKLPADAVARLTLADLQALESFFARRLDVPVETRAQLAGKFVENISRKAQIEVPTGMSREDFLEEVAYMLRSLTGR